MSRAALQKKSLREYKKYCEKNGKYAVGYAQWIRKVRAVPTLKRKKKNGKIKKKR